MDKSISVEKYQNSTLGNNTGSIHISNQAFQRQKNEGADFLSRILETNVLTRAKAKFELEKKNRVSSRADVTPKQQNIETKPAENNETQEQDQLENLKNIKDLQQTDETIKEIIDSLKEPRKYQKKFCTECGKIEQLETWLFNWSYQKSWSSTYFTNFTDQTFPDTLAYLKLSMRSCYGIGGQH